MTAATQFSFDPTEFAGKRALVTPVSRDDPAFEDSTS